MHNPKPIKTTRTEIAWTQPTLELLRDGLVRKVSYNRQTVIDLASSKIVQSETKNLDIIIHDTFRPAVEEDKKFIEIEVPGAGLMKLVRLV